MIIAVILFALLSISSASNFKIFKDKAPNIKSLGAIPVWTADECKKKIVEDKNVTVVAFSGTCCALYPLSGLDKLYLTANFMTNSILKEAKGWDTFVPNERKPFILWPLTEESQGKNFGTGGKALDLPIPKDRCKFVSEGPEPWIFGKFCKLVLANTYPAATVPIVQNDHRLIDFSKEFTFELWIKNYYAGVHQPIITTAPTSSVRFVFFPSYFYDQLTLAFSEKWRQFDYTTVDGTDKSEWRYLAVTYKPPNKVAFFKNAKKWPLSKKQMPENPKMYPTTHLKMFSDDSFWTRENTYATLAMVGIHKKALSQDELKELMAGGSVN